LEDNFTRNAKTDCTVMRWLKLVLRVLWKRERLRKRRKEKKI